MVTPSIHRMQLAALLVVASTVTAAADDLSNQAFRVQYDRTGVTSLRRTADVADTDYIAAGAAFGRLIIRYRTSAHGDWKELRDLLPTGARPDEITYAMGAPVPALASKASGSAVQGVAGIRGLNDGIVPRPAAGGRGGGPGTSGASADVPVFTWTTARGPVQWVQYTFPAEETVDRTSVFWTVAPASRPLLYQDGGQWKDVAPRGAYGRDVNVFTPVAFEPVKTMAVPFPFAERTGARGDIYTKKLLRHALITGHGSWIYWQRANAVGPSLVMTTVDDTKLEYFETANGVFTPYVHAAAASRAARAAGGNWRLPTSALTLAPGATTAYTFRFQWAADGPAVRHVLHAQGEFDTTVVSGMVVPSDLPAHISLRCRHTIAEIVPEHPSSTRIESIQGKPPGEGEESEV